MIATNAEMTTQDARWCMPDGTVLTVRTLSRGKPTCNVLLLPHLGETIGSGYYERIAQHVLEKNMAMHVVELRAHPPSQGSWSLAKYRHDIAHLIRTLAHSGEQLYVLAWGLSASTMLEYDDQAHEMRGAMPPLPDGMLLFDPIFSGNEILPKTRVRAHESSRLAQALVRRQFKIGKGYGFGACRLYKDDVFAAWRELSMYEFMPVRIQTPTVLLIPMETHADPLKRVFGSVRIQRVQWLHQFRIRTASAAESAHHLQEIAAAFSTMRGMEKPIRFTATR